MKESTARRRDFWESESDPEPGHVRRGGMERESQETSPHGQEGKGQTKKKMAGQSKWLDYIGKGCWMKDSPFSCAGEV